MEKTNRLLYNIEQEFLRLKKLEQTLYNNRNDINYDDVDYKIVKMLQHSLRRIVYGTM